MSIWLKSAILAATMTGLFAAPAIDAKPPRSGEAQLTEMLEGRQAGEPQRCISTFAKGNPLIIDNTAIVYRDGRTIWVNRTRDPASLDDDDLLVFVRYGGTELCRFDDVRTIDRFSGMLTGFVRLEDFVPYRMPARAGD